MALFGPDSSYLEDWRLGLQDALRRTRERLAEASSEDEESSEELANSQTPEAPKVPDIIARSHRSNILRNLREIGPTIIGGIGIAQGVAHLIWLLTEVISGNPGNLWEKHWAYADFGFGIGGIVIGVGCVWHLWWARKSGICFCLAALFSAYLWFADESNSDAERLLWATNVLNVPVSLGVLCYFLFGWPESEVKIFWLLISNFAKRPQGFNGARALEAALSIKIKDRKMRKRLIAAVVALTAIAGSAHAEDQQTKMFEDTSPTSQAGVR
jgi:hypothetical protein